MNIAISLNDNYVKPAIIMLNSLFLNNAPCIFNIYIVFSKLSDVNSAKLEQLIATNHGRCIKLEVEDSVFTGDHVLPHFTKETYYRLLLPSLLPDSIDRILYLDPDIIINDDISDFYNMNFNSYSAIAASVAKDNKRWDFHKRRLGLPEKSLYFNAGVLLMNLAALRNSQAFQEDYIFEYIKRNDKKLVDSDQSYLNIFLQGKCKILNCDKYNYDTRYWCNPKSSFFIKLQEIMKELKKEKAALHKAKIIHYRGESKPWDKKYNGKLYNLFWKYASISGYKRTKKECVFHAIEKIKNILSLLIK